MLIDADAQGHATRALGLAKYPGLYGLLVESADLQTVIKAIPAAKYGGDGDSCLYMIGSNIQTMHIATSISEGWALVEKLEPLRPVFDYCVIDTAPTPSLLHGAIYLATDWIIYPTLCEFWSFDGLAESLSHREALKIRGLPPIRVGGIVPMRYRANTLEHSENLAKLVSRFGELIWRPVPERIIWAEASTYQVPVFIHAPASEAACDAWELVDRVEELHGD